MTGGPWPVSRWAGPPPEGSHFENTAVHDAGWGTRLSHEVKRTMADEDWRRLAWRDMVRIRRFEEKSAELYMRGLVGGSLHLYVGQEAVAVGAISALSPDDFITMTYRGRGHALAKGIAAQALLAELLGRVDGTNRGKGGPMHIADPDHGVMGANAIVAAGVPIAAGLALATRKTGSGRVVMTFFGDGAVNQGVFHETLNLAALWSLPLVLVCENNLYAEMTPIHESVASDDLAARARVYRMGGFTVDGNDVAAVRTAALEAVERARSGGGPTFLEARTYRVCGHMVGDPETYRSPEEVVSWRERDPIVQLQEKLLQEGVATQAWLDEVDANVRSEMETAARNAESCQESRLADATADLY